MLRLGEIQEHLIAVARQNRGGYFTIFRLPSYDKFFGGMYEQDVLPSINRLIDRGLLRHEVGDVYQLSGSLSVGGSHQ